MASQTMTRQMTWARAASAALAFGVGFLPAAAGAADNLKAGKVIVVAGAESTQRRSEGGSQTEFSLQLPKGAACPGDSAEDGYRIQSFIVPASDDPGTLRYKSTKPDGDGRYALYDLRTRPYVQGFTAVADTPGGPGLIVDLPTFNFAVYPPGYFTAGRYRVGVACTLINETKRYWDTELELIRAPDDLPAEIRWRAIESEGGPSAGSQIRTTVVLAALAAAAAAAAAVLVRRRNVRRPMPTTTGDE
jgi:hypothetical protein